MRDFSFVRRFFATFLAILLIVPAAEAAGLPQQSDPSSPQPQSTQQLASIQPDNAAVPDAPEPQQDQKPAPSGNTQSNSSAQQNSTAVQGGTPVGTAAAPSEQPVGVAGSRPAGAVIAPAKQRRVRTILISVGVLIGAGVAIGTVAALSHSSPSTPR